MKPPIKVLLVDDKEDYCQSLAGSARYKNIQIIYKLDWETGFEMLKSDPSIEFIILDGKGKIEADQEKEKDNFALRAIDDIKAYSNKVSRHIPFCVNTGFVDRFENLEGTYEVFEKNDEQRDRMFEFVISKVTESKYRTLRLPFEEAFKVFDTGVVDKSYESLLIQIIKAYNSKDYRKSNINTQRDLLEAIFVSLNKEIPCIPSQLFNDRGNPNLESCTRYLELKDANGYKLDKSIPRVIGATFRKLKESTNEYSHLADEDIVKMPFLANTFLLMEVLEWLPIFVKENYANYI